MGNWATLGVPPPPKPVDRVSARRFIRAMLVRTLVIFVVGWIVVRLLNGAPGWSIILGVVMAALLAIDIAVLTWRIDRDTGHSRR